MDHVQRWPPRLIKFGLCSTSNTCRCGPLLRMAYTSPFLYLVSCVGVDTVVETGGTLARDSTWPSCTHVSVNFGRVTTGMDTTPNQNALHSALLYI